MTATEQKAKEIVIKMQFQKRALMFEDAKQCALIAVDEVIDAINGMVNEESGYSADEYYLEVKTEIEKL